jgi:hypothetical protein
MEAEMRSLGIDPKAAMKQIAEILGGQIKKQYRSTLPELKPYLKTPLLRELYEFSIGRTRGAGGVLGARRTKIQQGSEEFYEHFNLSVTHEACSYVQDTATLQRDLQCAFGSPHRVKEVMILRYDCS